ncbi:polysaccharide deacetylase family protein [Peptococcaceae bacterium 1198_IL3148]
MFVIKVSLIILFIYTLLPTILTRLFSLGAVQRGPRGHKEIFFTFDDGPDPIHTPQVLAVLKRHRITATFFVTGHNAQQHPEVIKQIIAAGHKIGIHSCQHRLAWLMTPWATIKDIDIATTLVKNVTAQAPVLYRPPWGVFNIVNFFTFLITGHRSVLWTFMGWDWTKNCTAEGITKLVSGRLKSGAILVLHDSAGPVGSSARAPQVLVKALPMIIEEIKQQGYRIGSAETLHAWSHLGYGKRTTIFWWELWERCFAWLAGVKPINGAVDATFKLAVRKHHGQPITLPDGTMLNPGDLMGELHFDNNLLLKLTSQSPHLEQVGIKLLRHVKDSLPLVAEALTTDPRYRNIKAVAGITMINRGARFFGFGTYDIYPKIFRLATTWYQRWLLVVFHPQGVSHLLKHRSKMVPKMIAISKAELLRRYQNQSALTSGSINPAYGTTQAR